MTYPYIHDVIGTQDLSVYFSKQVFVLERSWKKNLTNNF